MEYPEDSEPFKRQVNNKFNGRVAGFEEVKNLLKDTCEARMLIEQITTLIAQIATDLSEVKSNIIQLSDVSDKICELDGFIYDLSPYARK